MKIEIKDNLKTLNFNPIKLDIRLEFTKLEEVQDFLKEAQDYDTEYSEVIYSLIKRIAEKLTTNH